MADEMKEINDSMQDLENSHFDSSLIQDNKLVFYIDSLAYRVRMPSQAEHALTTQQKNLAQLTYMQQPGCITRKQLIKQLKDKEIIDLTDVDKQREALVQDLKNFWMALATRFSEDTRNIAELQLNIVNIQDKLKQLAMDTSNYLAPSLEERLDKFYAEFLTAICTEKQVSENEWVKVWSNFDEFLQADTKLTSRAIANMTWLLMNLR